MEKMKYKDWTWPENPETFLIQAEREAEYSKDSAGNAVFDGFGPLCRTFTGKGVFHGANAAASYRALAAFLQDTSAGELIHPVWGKFSACILELKMEEGSRENCVSYSFKFREADSSGGIPPLSKPTNWVIYTV